MFGKGWKFPYEGRLYQEEGGEHLYVTVDTGYTVIFTWDGEQAVNITRGCFWYELKKEGDNWELLDRKHHTTYYYNREGLLLSIADKNGQSIRLDYYEGNLTGITMPLGYHLEVTMREGRIIQLKDELGRTMQYRYENGLLSYVIHMDYGITHYEYDNRGFLIKAVDQAKVTYLENEYDDKGRVVLQTLANGDIYRAEYKEEERKVIVFSSVGNKTVCYEYGKYGEVLNVGYQDNTKTEYTYDEAGNRVSEVDRLGRKTIWEYDACNRVVKECHPTGRAHFCHSF